jgi:hypothetical protein
MADYHHNIFYYYTGAKQSVHSREQQLENNTTKALINTLEHCSSEVVIEFLRWLGITATEPVKFELQRATISEGDVESKSQRLLLGLTPSRMGNEFCIELVTPMSDSSLPDAWIYGSDYVVLIESKTTGSLDAGQMQRHFQKLRAGKDQPPMCKVCTWAEVHQFFRTLLGGLVGKDRWIVGQFTQYLEGVGMAEFTGFAPEIFDYFIARSDEDARQTVRGTMASFAEKIVDRLRSEAQGFDDWSWNKHLGNLGQNDDHCWVAFFDAGKQKWRHWAHQTISVSCSGLTVYVNVELKPAIDRLRSRVSQNRQTFRETILGLSQPFSIQIEERKRRQASVYDYHKVASLEASSLNQIEFDYIEGLLDHIDLPYLKVSKHIDRERALKLSQGGGEDLVDEVVQIMREFHPLVKFINI